MEQIPHLDCVNDPYAKQQIKDELMKGLFYIYKDLMRTEYMIMTPSYSHIVNAFVEFVLIWDRYPHEVLESFVFSLNIWAKYVSIIRFRDYIRCIRYYTFFLCNNTLSNSLLQDASNHIFDYTKRKDLEISFNSFLKTSIVSPAYFKPIPPSPESDIEILNNIEADNMHFADLSWEL